jgi:hypothetical protein
VIIWEAEPPITLCYLLLYIYLYSFSLFFSKNFGPITAIDPGLCIAIFFAIYHYILSLYPGHLLFSSPSIILKHRLATFPETATSTLSTFPVISFSLYLFIVSDLRSREWKRGNTLTSSNCIVYIYIFLSSLSHLFIFIFVYLVPQLTIG